MTEKSILYHAGCPVAAIEQKNPAKAVDPDRSINFGAALEALK
ncbi:hypothetical protein [Parahaliea mediterranea]|nr:hypothetical protein [Parahaliea mediterranea]